MVDDNTPAARPKSNRRSRGLRGQLMMSALANLTDSKPAQTNTKRVIQSQPEHCDAGSSIGNVQARPSLRVQLVDSEANARANSGETLRNSAAAARRGMRAKLISAALQPRSRTVDKSQAKEQPSVRTNMCAERQDISAPLNITRRGARGAILMATILNWRSQAHTERGVSREEARGAKNPPAQAPDKPPRTSSSEKLASHVAIANSDSDETLPAGFGLSIPACDVLSGAKHQGWGEIYSGTFFEDSQCARWVRCFLVLDEDNHLHAFLSPHSRGSLLVLPLLLMSMSIEIAPDHSECIGMRMASDFQRSARYRETRTSSSEDDQDSAAQGFDHLFLSRDCTNTYSSWEAAAGVGNARNGSKDATDARHPRNESAHASRDSSSSDSAVSRTAPFLPSNTCSIRQALPPLIDMQALPPLIDMQAELTPRSRAQLTTPRAQSVCEQVEEEAVVLMPAAQPTIALGNILAQGRVLMMRLADHAAQQLWIAELTAAIDEEHDAWPIFF